MCSTFTYSVISPWSAISETNSKIERTEVSQPTQLLNSTDEDSNYLISWRTHSRTQAYLAVLYLFSGRSTWGF